MSFTQTTSQSPRLRGKVENIAQCAKLAEGVLTRLWDVEKMEGYARSMSKKKGEGLKLFNKGFNVPDTYIIIFFVVVIAAIVTFFVPKG